MDSAHPEIFSSIQVLSHPETFPRRSVNHTLSDAEHEYGRLISHRRDIFDATVPVAVDTVTVFS